MFCCYDVICFVICSISHQEEIREVRRRQEMEQKELMHEFRTAPGLQCVGSNHDSGYAVDSESVIVPDIDPSLSSSHSEPVSASTNAKSFVAIAQVNWVSFCAAFVM